MDDFFQGLLAGDNEQAVGARFVNSWSTNRDIAESFSSAGNKGMLMSKHIDPDDVFASFLEHPEFSSFGEQEVLWYNWEGTLVPKSVTIKPGTTGSFGRQTVEVELW